MAKKKEQLKTITLDVYNSAGEVVSKQELNPEIFGLTFDPGLVNLAVVAQRANARKVIAHTKTKGEVRGGGRKPWKQKGTGRARQGSIRAPQWKGGGIVFGPRNDRNFELKINKKAKMKALFMTMSAKAQDSKIILINEFNVEKSKTKQAYSILKKLPVGIDEKKKRQNKLLYITANKSPIINRSLKNIPFVNIIGSQSLNVVDLLNCKYMILPSASLEEITKTYLKK